MRGHNICFYLELTKIILIIKYSLLSRAVLICSQQNLINQIFFEIKEVEYQKEF